MSEITLEQVYHDYYSKIYGFVFNRVNDTSLTEDITSDIFIKITEHIDSFDSSKASLATWIYTIANRTLTDYYRSHRVFSEIPEEDGENGAMPDALVDNTELDQNLLLEEQLQQLALALQSLPERERDLIILHYYSGIALKVIAVKMGMSYINAKLIHKKALGKLKKQMDI